MGRDFKDNTQIKADMDRIEAAIKKESGEKTLGDLFFWHNSFLCGVVTSKDMFLKAARAISPEFIPYGTYRQIYELYLAYYRDKRICMSGRTADQVIAEMPVVEDDKREMLRLIVEMSCRNAEGLTHEEFDAAIDNLLNRRKGEVFNQRMMDAVEAKRSGDIKKADRVLEGYLSEFRHLDERSEPRPVSQEIGLLDASNDVHRYCYSTFSNTIDRYTGGGYRGETWIVGGYTSDGKTALSKELIWPSVKNNERILWVSLEMECDEMMAIFSTRMAQDLGFTGLTLNKIRRKEFLNDEEKGQWDQVQTEMRKLSNLWLYHPCGKFTMRDLEAEVDRMKAKGTLDIVVVDYLELMDATRRSESYRLELKETMRLAKRLAADKDVWLIIPHQISRHGRAEAQERKPYPYYVLSDLQESSGVEQNCVVMVWIYQDEQYRGQQRVRIGVSKNRMGARCEQGWEASADFSRCKITEDGNTLVNIVTVSSGRKKWSRSDTDD